MNTFKKFFIIILISIVLLPLFAEEDVDLNGKTIQSINFLELNNVREKTAQSLVSSFVGKSFSDELFASLEDTLYAQSWLNYVEEVNASLDSETGGIILTITVNENPIIADVEISGNERLRSAGILDSQTLKKGGYLSTNNLNSNISLIRDYYLSRGYKDVEVSATMDEGENNSVSVHYNIIEGRQYKVRAVLFEGINSLTREELKKLLTTKVKSFFDSGNFVLDNIEKDKNAILNYYATKGYPDCRIISSDIVEIEEESNEKTCYLNIVYHIEEGSLWTISNVNFHGNTIFSDEEVGGYITVKEGDNYNIELIQRILENIASLYYDSGYVYSNVQPQIMREDGNKVSIDLAISEGVQTVVEEIRINGLTKTKPYVFERELDMKVGDVFSRASFIQSQQNMYNTSLLKNITAAIYPGKTENGVICEFNVEEGNQMELQFGATFGATELNGFPVSGFLSLTNTNLGGTGKALSLSTELSPTTQSVSLSLSDKWVGDKRWSNGVSLSFARNVRTGALQKGIGSNFYDGRDENKETYPLGFQNPYEWYVTNNQNYPSSNYLMDYDYYSFDIGYNTGYTWVFSAGQLSLGGGVSVGLNRAIYDNNKFTPYEKLIKQYNEKWQFANKFSASVSWDGRNYVDSTPHGYVLSASYTYSGGVLGGLSNYNKVSLSASAYRGIIKFGGKKEDSKPKHLILGVSSDVSFMLPQYRVYGEEKGWYDAKKGTTKYEMLYIDGMNIGRGFSIIPDLSFLWNNQITLTYPLAEDIISLEGFVSATGALSNLNDLNRFSSIDWYMAAGAGIKMEIPGFPLGLYLVKNATIKQNEGWKWQDGRIGLGLSLVLAITTSIY